MKYRELKDGEMVRVGVKDRELFFVVQVFVVTPVFLVIGVGVVFARVKEKKYFRHFLFSLFFKRLKKTLRSRFRGGN